MAADHLQFLKNRFLREFEEADEEFTSRFPIRNRWKDVMEVVQARTISRFTPIRMKGCLYHLIHALAECRIISERHREREAQKKKRVCFFGLNYSPAECWRLLQITRKLCRIKRTLLYELPDDHDAAATESGASEVRTYQPQDFPNDKIHGFDDQVERLEAFLLGNGGGSMVTGISIAGMGGSGKTSLARSVFIRDQVQQRFSPMIWVELPNDLDPDLPDWQVAIVRSILKQLQCHDDRGDHDLVDDMLQEMRRRLDGNRYLIVLDNAWRASEWYANLASGSLVEGAGRTRLCHGLPGGSGGAVIVTSRLDQVAKAMVAAGGGGGCLHHHVQPVSDAGALRSIFVDSCNNSIKEYLSRFLNRRDRTIVEAILKRMRDEGILERMMDEGILERLKDEVVDRCEGLPLAAKALGAIIATPTQCLGPILMTGNFIRRALEETVNYDGIHNVLTARYPPLKHFLSFYLQTMSDPSTILSKLPPYFVLYFYQIYVNQIRGLFDFNISVRDSCNVPRNLPEMLNLFIVEHILLSRIESVVPNRD